MTKCGKCGCNGRLHNRFIPASILIGALYSVLFLFGVGVFDD